jgi:hypothetical protein
MPDILTTEDEQCEECFQKSTTRSDSGQFVVSLPFKSTVRSLAEPSTEKKMEVQGGSTHNLGSSRAMALNRLYNLECRLAKDSELYTAYRKFMETLKHPVVKLVKLPTDSA